MLVFEFVLVWLLARTPAPPFKSPPPRFPTSGDAESLKAAYAATTKWWQRAAQQGYEQALKGLCVLHKSNLIRTPPPSCVVTAILLTSAKAAKYNKKRTEKTEKTGG